MQPAETPNKIFLDLDDVLNSFTMYALSSVGCPVSAHELEKFDPSWGFDIIKAANFLHPEGDFTLESFWKKVKREVWATAPISELFENLIEHCMWMVHKSNICILSSPTNDPECLAGKMEWIYTYCPEWLHKQFLFGPPKHMCASEFSLLIDDSEANYTTFRLRGGHAILVPRPWNSLHEIYTNGDAWEYVNNHLEKIF